MVDSTPARLLRSWIVRQAAAPAIVWLDESAAEIVHDPSSRALGLALGLAPRRVGKAVLDLADADRRAANDVRAGWTPGRMSLDQAARIWLLLRACDALEPFAPTLRTLLATADVGEAVAIYRGLPLYPASGDLVGLAVEGLRTSIRDVFEAVALDSPFPAERFSDDAWKQMVLKALFVDATLDRIQGLDRRWTADLARTLVDYAHERQAAKRSVNPELWRGVGRFADDAASADLAAVLRGGTSLERAAAALALSESGSKAAAVSLAADREHHSAVRAGTITWAAIARGDARDGKTAGLATDGLATDELAINDLAVADLVAQGGGHG